MRKLSIGVSRPSSSWLTLLILLVVLAPSVSLVWFMNQAVQNERLAARQKLAEAYRAQLAFAQELLTGYWRRYTDELEAQTETLPAPALFAKQVRAGLANAVICFDASGAVVYPAPAPPPPREVAPDSAWAEAERLQLSDGRAAAQAYARIAEGTTNTDSGARAVQAQARCLIQAGLTNEAISVVLGPLQEERYANATDAQGRLIAPNAELLALELLSGPALERKDASIAHLKSRLLDYDAPMSSAQRRFLARELQKLVPDAALSAMLAAEELAASCVEADQAAPTRRLATPEGGGDGLRPAALPGVWKLVSSNGRILALFRTESLLTRMRAGASSQTLPADVSLTFLPPGKDPDAASVSTQAGPMLPGWRLALALNNQHLFVSAADQQIASYVWIGALVLVTVAVLAALALGMVRRQMALTRLRNDLVANVSHELKTPLSSMRLLVETLLNSEKPDPRTVREYLELIAQENLRLSRLIDNFLTFSRIERNKYAFKFKELPAARIVEEARAAIQDRFNAAGCAFGCRVASNLPLVVADKDAMVTVLLNLLDNAFKYTGEGKQISLEAAAENGCVRYRVKDNGIGLWPRDIKRIFKRFYQVDQRQTRTGGGLAPERSGGGCGLGLSIVKFIVTAHHGEIAVESQPRKGSTFTVSIPAKGAVLKQEQKP